MLTMLVIDNYCRCGYTKYVWVGLQYLLCVCLCVCTKTGTSIVLINSKKCMCVQYAFMYIFKIGIFIKIISFQVMAILVGKGILFLSTYMFWFHKKELISCCD